MRKSWIATVMVALAASCSGTSPGSDGSLSDTGGPPTDATGGDSGGPPADAGPTDATGDGGGATCASLCAQQGMWPACVNETTCNSTCSGLATTASATGCSSPMNALLNCEYGLSMAQVCGGAAPTDPTGPCGTQYMALVSCGSAYCTAHPTDPACH